MKVSFCHRGWMFNLNEFEIMAKPIKETPVLTGKDAERFAQAVANPKKVVREDVLRAQAVYKRLYACSELR